MNYGKSYFKYCLAKTIKILVKSLREKRNDGYPRGDEMHREGMYEEVMYREEIYGEGDHGESNGFSCING